MGIRRELAEAWSTGLEMDVRREPARACLIGEVGEITGL